MRTKVKLCILAVCLGILIVGGFSIYSTFAYLSNKTGATNKFTFGNVTAEIVESFSPPARLVTGENSYTKKIQVQNGGTVPAYARVWLGFTDVDVENISKVSADNGHTWYTLSEFKSHLPSGWVFGSGDLHGYFYYTSPIQPGSKTPTLITNVKTTFINKTADTNTTINQTVRNYDILVYAETVQQAKLNGSGLNTSYSTAWQQFLDKK